MGQRASQVGALNFDECDLAADALLGRRGPGLPHDDERAR